MDLSNLSVFSLANKNMKYLTERQKVLATNIANANTPGYLPQDVKKPDFGSELVAGLAMKTTNPKHMNGIAYNAAGKVYTPKPATALTIDGNGVVLEEQMNEASKTSSEYNRMISIYTKYKEMLNVANTKISS